MKRVLAGLLLSAALAAPAYAALKPGAAAPDFTLTAALAGKDFSFNLKDALKKGPVVLYFFPAAFTAGCTAEAHAFAEATDDFKKQGATLIGVTAGNVDQLADFSAKKCAGKFPVAAASAKMKADYDVDLKKPDGTSTGVTNRTTYVIAPNGKIAMVYSAMQPNEHVSNSLAALQSLKKG